GSLLWLVCIAKDLVMLSFAGVLLAVVISWPADLLTQHTRLKRWQALILVILTFAIIASAATYRMGSAIATQITELREKLPETIQTTTDRLQATDRGQFFFEQTKEIWKAVQDYLTKPEAVLGRAGGVLTTTFGFIANIMLVLILAIFLAISPTFYYKGLITLAPIHARERFQTVLLKVAHTIRWWFFGQLCSMLIVGSLTFLGLKMFGVPLALTLSVIAALLNFIPNFGPILAAIPAILLALTHNTQTADLNYASAIYVAIWYIVIQNAEGSVITPWIQHRTVALPPALIILFQVLLALLVGPIGLLLATPMLATLLVLVKLLYIEDTLGDRGGGKVS
ncbi:MAG: AI-2E family transporter, partial [Phycisphaerales bacterium]|nr:AI-2E family transporter [Phycisphaerales bacterium]